ncbi:MAG: hypothetical protein LBS50_08825 [Prevotellaceae bacterium]|jgi:hypothetical protein|nr:hypothetical protein [Prevotellaceae bacterium]
MKKLVLLALCVASFGFANKATAANGTVESISYSFNFGDVTSFSEENLDAMFSSFSEAMGETMSMTEAQAMECELSGEATVNVGFVKITVTATVRGDCRDMKALVEQLAIALKKAVEEVLREFKK